MKRWMGASIMAAGLGAPGLAAAAESEIKVSRQDCSAITIHQPRADVEYKPGVDVRGRPVAPADLPGGSSLRIPDEITIDIGFNLAEKYGIGAGGRFKGESVIGKVTVKQGRVYWNDQLLADGEQNAIAEACQKLYGARK